ncbi:hypothetical protein [Leucobacter luti]|uniref:Uncharacterized protein n=1 Tax=Leucobacter luti TaxID=340320 RepID=A0A4Q7TQ73_9MICO|nr:hypothetical protein [Leucobacter luti]MBL3699773.1 hypothetical protein [Leucobacter luti]RZT62906.1 hypothetical protein EV139_2615 [Leucobacter luti]
MASEHEARRHREAGDTGDTGGAAHSATPAPPLPEPADPRSASELAALMFKPPLGSGRRVPAAPEPSTAPPRAGARPELPVVYGARPAPSPLGGRAPDRLPPRSTPGAQEAGQDRSALPSVTAQNRRFRRLALLGGTGMVLIVGAGLWGLAQLGLAWL